MTPEQEIERAGKAQRLLKDEIYNETWDALRDRVTQQLSLAETAGEKRERLNYLLVAIESARRYAEQIVISGKMAAQQIERDKTFKERVGERIRSIA